jgi:antitoxin CptB
MNERLRKIAFRANHRGMKELDLILGRFADAHLAELSGEELEQFEGILQVPDPQVYAWIMGTETVPVDHDCTVLSRLRQFRILPADYTQPR